MCSGKLLELCREARGSDLQFRKIMQTAPRRIFLLRRKKEGGEELLGFGKHTWRLTGAEGGGGGERC